MRALYFLPAGLLVLMPGSSAHAQVLTGPVAKRGEVKWLNTYLGWAPQAWFKSRGPLTPELMAQAASRPADSLALVLLPDYRTQLPNGNQYLRVQLLNPTAQPLPIERADATVPGVSLVLRLDERWVRPAYPLRSYCGNSFWQDTLAARTAWTIDLTADHFYQGTVPMEARILAQVGHTVVKSPIFTVQLTPLQLYYLRHPRVPLPDIN